MSLRLRIRPEAESDLAEACRWYSQQAQGLAEQFLEEVGIALSRIEEQPGLYGKLHKDIRRTLVRRFPFGIFYIEQPHEIAVLAVMHLARDPGRWKERK